MSAHKKQRRFILAFLLLIIGHSVTVFLSNGSNVIPARKCMSGLKQQYSSKNCLLGKSEVQEHVAGYCYILRSVRHESCLYV